MQVWNVLCAARWKYRTKKSPKITIWAPSHNFVRLYLRNWGTYRQSEKKLKQQYLLHMSPQYGELRTTSGWDPSGSLGHPCKFQRVSRLGGVTARHCSSGHVGISHTLQRWTEVATYIWQGGHHIGHWPIFLVYFCILWSLIKMVSPSSNEQPLSNDDCLGNNRKDYQNCSLLYWVL